MSGATKHINILYLILFTALPVLAQDKMNSYDSTGKRHGAWKEYYDSTRSQPKFEGKFEHGKKTGLFKFYQVGLKQPVAVMDFDPYSEKVKAKYLTQDGHTISEGEFVNQEREGAWTYYHKNSEEIMMTEHYEDGTLHGQKKVYYDNGELAEEANYIQGALDGPRKLYSVKGIVLEDLIYKSGKLHGPARFYNGKGEIVSEGVYYNDKHHGTWKYYENGELKEEKYF